MECDRGRKTFKYRLKPAPALDRALAVVVWRCHELYNAGLEERKRAWEKCHASVTFALQSAQLPGLKELRPEYRDLNAQVLPDVLHRLDKAFQAFFRRVAAGDAPGYPRFQGRDRYSSFTYPQAGAHGGVRLANGFLVLSKIGRIVVRWSRPLEGTPKTVTISREADGWYVAFSCVVVPAQPLPLTGRETGIDVGLRVFLVTAAGEVVEHPRHHRRGEQRLVKAQRQVSRRQRGATVAGKRWCCSPKPISTSNASASTTTTRRRSGWSGGTTRSITRPSGPPTSVAGPPQCPMVAAGMCQMGPHARPVSTRVSKTPDGAASAPSSLARQHAPGSEWKRSIRRIPARTVASVGSACPRA